MIAQIGLIVMASVAVAALLFVWFYTWRVMFARLRDEATAARMERQELLNRIQHPQLIPPLVQDPQVAQREWEAVALQVKADEEVEREWEASDESLVPFDDDLADLD